MGFQNIICVIPPELGSKTQLFKEGLNGKKLAEVDRKVNLEDRGKYFQFWHWIH